VLADSAYASGPMLAALQTAGHTAIVRPWPLKSMIENGFTLVDFTVDTEPGPRTPFGAVTCPAGVVAALTSAGKANFKTACASCLLRARCTASAAGRSVLIGEYDALERAHRANAARP